MSDGETERLQVEIPSHQSAYDILHVEEVSEAAVVCNYVKVYSSEICFEVVDTIHNG